MAVNGVNGTNGSSHKRPLWRNGPGAPLTTPFKAGEDEIDHEALAKQVVRCAKAGINIVLLGTTGEGASVGPLLYATFGPGHPKAKQR
jgi:hypothetical protein